MWVDQISFLASLPETFKSLMSFCFLIQIGPMTLESGVLGLSRFRIVNAGGTHTGRAAAVRGRGDSVVNNLVLISGNSDGVENSGVVTP